MKFEFEKQFGEGTDPWYAKAERWAKKQRYPISFLLLGVIEWLKQKWIDVKIYNTMRDVDRQSEAIKKIWEEDTEENPTSWRQEYLEMKAGLSKLQIQLLKEGPHQLAQAWLLQAMHNDWKRMKGIKEPPSRESGYQTSLKEWLKNYN